MAIEMTFKEFKQHERAGEIESEPTAVEYTAESVTPSEKNDYFFDGQQVFLAI